LGTTIAIGRGVPGFWNHAVMARIVALIGLIGVLGTIRKMKWGDEK